MVAMIAALLALVVAFGASVSAQRQTRTVLDGVYAAEQAARGSTLFAANCAMCHGERLTGGTAPALVGENFMKTFEAGTVGQLFTTMRTRMPQTNPGILKEDEYLALASFVLQSNGFPAGEAALTADAAALGSTRIVRREPPKEVANFSLVGIVGCLTETAGGWQVLSASKPYLTKNANASAGGELSEATAREMGSDTVNLLFVTVQQSSAQPLKDRRVEAKGLLIRGPNEIRLNLTSVQGIGDACR